MKTKFTLIKIILLYIISSHILAFAQTTESVNKGPDNTVAATTSDTMIFKEAKDKSVFTGVLRTVWGKLKNFSPKTDIDRSSRSTVTATMGIRGAETTASLLQPYWKGDRTNDKAFIEELNAYSAAQLEIDNGNNEQGKKSLDNFLKTYPDSTLQPNALFAKGLLLGGTGDSKGGISVLSEFIKTYKAHPLAEDAKLVIAELSK